MSLVDTIIKARSQEINHSCEKCVANRHLLNEIMVNTADMLGKVIDLLRVMDRVPGLSFQQRAMLSAHRDTLKTSIESMIK